MSSEQIAKEIADAIDPCIMLGYEQRAFEIIAARLKPLVEDAERWRRLCEECAKADVCDKSTTHFGEICLITTKHESELLRRLREARADGMAPRKRGD